MIQRRQSIYMFFAAVLSALLFFVPLATFVTGDNVMTFTVFGIDNPGEMLSLESITTWPLIVLAILMTLVPFITIFLYKKREKQVRLCRLNLLVNIIFIGLVFLYYENDILMVVAAIEGDSYELDVAYFIGMAFPLVNLVLEILAIRGIKKDIELLKSVDRLR